MFFQALSLLFQILPVPAAIIVLGIVAVMVLVIVFKLVKLVLDAIPFL